MGPRASIAQVTAIRAVASRHAMAAATADEKARQERRTATRHACVLTLVGCQLLLVLLVDGPANVGWLASGPSTAPASRPGAAAARPRGAERCRRPGRRYAAVRTHTHQRKSGSR